MNKSRHNGVNRQEETPLDERAEILAAFQAGLDEQLSEPDPATGETTPQFDARFTVLEISPLDYLQFMRIEFAFSEDSRIALDEERKNEMKKSTKDDAKGKLRQAKGVIKQAAGKIAGSPGLKAEGLVDETAGKVQQKVARVEKAVGH
jgi:uncharacterized protein YjbJ (UPF0337 family)